MKISVNLINKYLKKPLATQLMAETFERTEVEVEDILYANKLDEKIIVARVLKLEKHPNADKLKIARVETDSGIVKVVCGAPNIETGMTVALAQVGTALPSGDVISEASIRGEKSSGMLCSAMELGWGDDHSGLVSLDPNLPLGQSLCDIAKNSDVIDIKTPSNRWDYLSYVGLSREIAACLSDNSLVEPDNHKNAYNDREAVKVKQKEACPVFMSVKVKVDNRSKSPQWLVDNLNESGMRSINPVVDITNFVMLELGQPSHAYDAKKIKGGLGVRFASGAESLTTLEGQTIKLNDKDLVIVDKSGPVALAGVMGGASTETTAETEEIILEVANFDKTTIRRSALRHGIRTEASARFEKGLPLPLPHLAANRIIALLKEICNASIDDSPVLQVYSPIATKYLGMRVRKAERFLGYRLDEKEVMDLLTKRGFRPTHFSLTKEIRSLQAVDDERNEDIAGLLYTKAGISIGADIKMRLKSGMEVPRQALKPGDLLFEGQTQAIYIGKGKMIYWDDLKKQVVNKSSASLTKSDNFKARRFVENFNHIISVEVPWWRLDINQEADLFEEVAKSIGYDHMPETLSTLPASDTKNHSLLPSLMDIRTVLQGTGVIEVMTYSFISLADLRASKCDEKSCLQIENPISREQDYLRTNMLASHLRAAEKNHAKSADSIYEISRVYEKSGKGVSESWKLSFMVWGDQSLLRLKGLIDMVCQSYGATLEIQRDLNSHVFISNRSGVIKGGLGRFGQVQTTILNNFDVQMETSWAEINAAELIASATTHPVKEPVPYQLIKKDLTLELDNLATFAEASSQLEGLVKGVEFKSEFTSKELNSASKKRITLGLTLDLGPNPKAKEINLLLERCADKLQAVGNAKVV